MWYLEGPGQDQACYSAGHFFTKEWCQEVVEAGGAFEPHPGYLNGERLDTKIRRSEIRDFLPNQATAAFYQAVTRVLTAINADLWNFDLEHIQTMQLTEYRGKNKGGYDFHMDMGGVATIPRTRKLSMTILLNDPSEFTGGEFEVMRGSDAETVDLAQGQAVIFPSFLMHRVRPVTKGVRRSLVAWVAGPAWR